MAWVEFLFDETFVRLGVTEFFGKINCDPGFLNKNCRSGLLKFVNLEQRHFVHFVFEQTFHPFCKTASEQNKIFLAQIRLLHKVRICKRYQEEQNKKQRKNINAESILTVIYDGPVITIEYQQDSLKDDMAQTEQNAERNYCFQIPRRGTYKIKIVQDKCLHI